MKLFYKTLNEFCEEQKKLDKQPLKKYLFKIFGALIYLLIIFWIIIFFVLTLFVLLSPIGLFLIPFTSLTIDQYSEIVGKSLLFSYISLASFIAIYIYLEFQSNKIFGYDFDYYLQILKEWKERCKSYQKTEKEIDNLLEIS